MGAKTTWGIGILLGLLSTAALGQEPPPQIDITIAVYDAAQLGAKTLHQTEGIAGAILQPAGIQSHWNAGPMEDLRDLGTDFTAYSRTECEERPSLAALRIQIVARAPSGVAMHALGYSLPCAKRGVQVTIYADRVASVTEMGGPTFVRVLGYAIAHELGHVLLHSGAHGTSGLMKDVWSKRDWQRAAVSIIPFNPAERQKLAGLRQRVADRDVPQWASLEVH